MWRSNAFVIFCILNIFYDVGGTRNRQRRYLLFTKATQWGVFATVSIPLHPDTTVSAAWFFEANYYNVDNSSYFDPLLGDIEISSKREQRKVPDVNHFTRSHFYRFIESMLERHGWPGRVCLLRAICENSALADLQSGVLGDLVHFILTPSSSLAEDDIDDSYYEAEYRGMELDCSGYHRECPQNPIELFSILYKS